MIAELAVVAVTLAFIGIMLFDITMTWFARVSEEAVEVYEVKCNQFVKERSEIYLAMADATVRKDAKAAFTALKAFSKLREPVMPLWIRAGFWLTAKLLGLDTETMREKHRKDREEP
jgi:hypothetical protein